jgi:dolichol-phosphate mannosyltransferase
MPEYIGLAIVIPVYNEQNNIQKLIEDLHESLFKNDINHYFIIVNDGSTDKSLDILDNISKTINNLKVISKKNSGHGPSIYTGYQLAAEYDWVFQIDSDYDYDLNSFITLWNNRKEYDILLAERQYRTASTVRNLLTSFTSIFVNILFGKTIKDINSPYRLLNNKKLAPILNLINPNSFAPNVLITAYFLKKGYRFFIIPATLNKNNIGRKSKAGLYILKGSVKSFIALFTLRFKL